MNNIYIILPVIIHMATAILCLASWSSVRLQKVISIVGNLAALIVSLFLFKAVYEGPILTMQSGNWEAPFGITFVADTLSVMLVTFSNLVALAISIYAIEATSTHRKKYGFYAIVHFLIMGLNGAFLTGDIFNLYVWFEIVIISSFVLMTLGGKKPQMEGAIKYVAMNMLASIFFLTAIGILYGIAGSLNMADLAGKIAAIENRGLVNVTALIFFVGFGIKSAVFPMYFWLPSSYHTPPSVIAAIFGGLLTKIGIYAIIRMFSLLFVMDTFLLDLFVILAILTMITGAIGAWSKTSIRRMFSYLIVCHIGYLIAGLGLFTQLALTGVVFYLMHDIIIKTNIFLMSGVIYKIRKTTDLRRLGSLYKDYPLFSIAAFLILFSLAGIPPLSGFWPKIQLFGEAMSSQQYILLITLIIASFATLFLMAKIWIQAFWKPFTLKDEKHKDFFQRLTLGRKAALIGPVVGLLLVTLWMGVGANMFYEISSKIAYELMHPDMYINAVLK